VSVTDAIGWIAALSSACVALPQGLRILATRSVAGISRLIWQMTLAGGIAWFVHGMVAGRAQIIWPNAVLSLTSAWVVIMVCRATGGSRGGAFALPALGALLAVGIEAALGPVAFGVAMFVPSAIGQISQLIAIRKAADTTGVSLSGLLVALACQILWLCYAFPAGESAIAVTATPTAALMVITISALQIKRARSPVLVLLG
jgi:uncharacterized protein with PQ loop repeat